MIRRIFCTLVLVAVPATCVMAPAMAQSTVIIPIGDHQRADQQSAIIRARQLIAAGNLDLAVSELSEFVNSHPDGADAARFLGDLYYRQGHFDRAESIYRALLAHNGHDKETHNRLGVVYATENRVEDAIQEFQSALPGTDSIRDLVLMHVRKGDLSSYESDMVRAAKDEPSDPDAQEELGEIYQTMHEPSEAILYFQRALDDDAHSIAALNGLGMAYLDMHAPSMASRYLQDCLNLDPFNYACLDNMGVSRIQATQYGDAFDVFVKAHRLEPERPEAIVNFGYLADMRGDWKRAVSFYVQAIAVDPYVPESYVNLGIDYEHNDLYNLAQAALLKGVAATPWDGRVRYLLARAYAAQGQKTLALAQLKAAQASLDPDVAAIAKEEAARLTATSMPAAP